MKVISLTSIKFSVNDSDVVISKGDIGTVKITININRVDIEVDHELVTSLFKLIDEDNNSHVLGGLHRYE